jgi:hypothetical protein
VWATILETAVELPWREEIGVYEYVYEYERERLSPILLPYSYTYSYTHISRPVSPNGCGIWMGAAIRIGTKIGEGISSS